MRFLSLVFFWGTLTTACFGASITIYNDSPYPLIATILSADGKQLKSMQMRPQQNAEWDDPSPPNAIYSQTPYTVIFECKTGGHFGTYRNVSPGAWVTPSGATGGQGYCKPQKDNQKDAESNQQAQQQPQQPQQPQQQSPADQQSNLNLGPP